MQAQSEIESEVMDELIVRHSRMPYVRFADEKPELDLGTKLKVLIEPITHVESIELCRLVDGKFEAGDPVVPGDILYAREWDGERFYYYKYTFSLCAKDGIF